MRRPGAALLLDHEQLKPKRLPKRRQAAALQGDDRAEVRGVNYSIVVLAGACLLDADDLFED